jgi:hypothetical protein
VFSPSTYGLTSLASGKRDCNLIGAYRAVHFETWFRSGRCLDVAVEGLAEKGELEFRNDKLTALKARCDGWIALLLSAVILERDDS